MTAAKVATVAKTKTSGLPDQVAHTAKLRSQGLTDAQVTKALKDMGYPDQGAATSKTPRPAPATAAPAAEPAPGRPAGSKTRYLPSPPAQLTGGAAGFLMGLGGTAVLINFMRGGTPGVKRWFAAKFMNVVTGAATGASASGAAVKVSTTAPVLPGTTQWGQW